MKAAVLSRYDRKGCRLEIVELPDPEPKGSEVLVRVLAAGVNPLDNMIVRGEVRAIVNYRMPLVMGNEFCGIVEGTGPSASRFPLGTRVYGRLPLGHIGAFAELIAVDESALAEVPAYLDDTEAAAVPLGALTALQALEVLGAKQGDSLFISGGSGSLGAMAIPIAARRGLHVFTSGGAESCKRVLALGAQRFFDYRTEDYTDMLSDVDSVIDTLGGRELAREFSILKEGGHLVSLRGMPNGRFAKRSGMGPGRRLMFGAAGMKFDRMARKRRQTYDFLFVHENGKQLAELDRLFDAEHPLRPSIDAVFALDEVNEAMEKVLSGRSRGKTMLKLS